MGFVQTITIEAEDIGPIRDLLSDWHSNQSGVAPGYLSNRLLADREQPGRYIILVEFSSADEAAQNNQRPETAAWAESLANMISGEAKFVQFDEAHRSG